MKTIEKQTKKTLSDKRLARIRAQGYTYQSDAELNELAFGHRFAVRMCLTVLLTAIIMGSIPLLSVMMVIAFFGVVLPYHPFDYIYNHVVRKWVNKPALPRRSLQLKFACFLATPWIAGVIYLVSTNQMTAIILTHFNYTL